MLKKMFKKTIIIILILIVFSTFEKVYADSEETLTNATRVYFNAEVTKTYGNGDLILLENYDAEGNKIYGLIDAGRNLTKNDKNGNPSKVAVEFLKDHNVETLEFFLLTHIHGDHIGMAIDVLDNFTVNKLYMKEFDKEWSPSGSGSFENIVKKTIEKNVHVVGTSYISLISKTISPSLSTSFIEYVNANANPDLFESFYYNTDEDNNIKFSFGSSNIKIFNWEMFDENGEQLYTSDENGGQYITSTGETLTSTGEPLTREIVSNENNNSLAILLTQGNKKALFSGDMNNLDKNVSKGRIGDEDRLKNQIGDIDLLKLGHHGYSGSNTISYLEVLKPEYAVATNDLYGIYKQTAKWLETNGAELLYTTNDKYGISATITNNDVYFGFETTGIVNTINGINYYIPEDCKYENYKEIGCEIVYQDEYATVDNWEELKNVINDNKDDFTINREDKKYNVKKLIINLLEGDYTATDGIEILNYQNIVLTSSYDITILRGSSLTNKPLFYVNGTLDLGTNEMTGSITLDGNNVESSTNLIYLEMGNLNIYENIKLCNNYNKTITRTGFSENTYTYAPKGSAICSITGNINMYGGEISGNKSSVAYVLTLPKAMTKTYYLNTYGSGIYVGKNSVFNMYDGEIYNNISENNSVINTNSEYTYCSVSRATYQNMYGVGLYVTGNSIANLHTGEISNNTATNNSVLNIKESTILDKVTELYSFNNCISGTGVYANDSTLNIFNDFSIKDNKSYNNSSISLEENTKVRSTVYTAIRGNNIGCVSSDVSIDGTDIGGGTCVQNYSLINEGKIGSQSTNITGGELYFSKSKIDISNLNIDGNIDYMAANYGGTICITASSSGTISNSNFSNYKADQNGGSIYINDHSNVNLKNVRLINNSSAYGGAVYVNSISELKCEECTISSNTANYGGGIYSKLSTNNIIIKNSEISNNKTIAGSGGGIYAYGDLEISGKSTLIKDNEANTYGGGIMIKSNAVINSGTISGNKAINNAGGGIRVDGSLTLNGGTIENNIAKITGGGIDYTGGNLIFNAGIIRNNTLFTGEESQTNPTMENYIKIKNLSDVHKALKEVAYSYYMRGPNIQYNTRKGLLSFYSPEEATSQNTNYLVCSAYPKNVYYELLGIKIPPYTADLISYARKNQGNSEVVGYGCKITKVDSIEDKNGDGIDDKNGNKIGDKLFYNQKIVDENGDGIDDNWGLVITDLRENDKYIKFNDNVVLKNPTPEEILPYLECGDVLTYTGHAMLIYDLIYDEYGNVIDAYTLESGYGSGNNYVMSKIPGSVKIGDLISFTNSNHYLYHNSRENITLEDGLLEGSLHLGTLKGRKYWNLNKNTKDEYSILRFIQEDEDSNIVLCYDGTGYSDSKHDNELITLSDKDLDRLKYSRLYIEKTVDKHADDVVESGEELIYTIRIKNNSNAPYDDELIVTENISEYVDYIGNECDFDVERSGNVLSWNIGELESGEEVEIKYKVQVKEDCIGNTIESTGKVGNIDSAKIKNTISVNLTENQEEKIEEKYNTLKDTYTGKELINEIYKQAIGIDLDLNEFEITDLVKNTSKSGESAETLKLNESNSYYQMVLNKYWNCLAVKQHTYKEKTIYEYDLKSWGSYTSPEKRADTINSENFRTGDILIYTNHDDVLYTYDDDTDIVSENPITYEDGEYVYIYIENQGFVGVNFGKDEIAGTQDDRNEFNSQYYADNCLNVYSDTSVTDIDTLNYMNYQTLFGKDYYVILRPSMLNDLEGPNIEISGISDEWTNQNIEIIITATDDLGVKYIKVNGEIVRNGEYTITENGTYIITAEDNYGNISTEETEVTTIDKIAPRITNIEAEREYGEAITPIIVEEGSGIKQVVLTKGEVPVEGYERTEAIRENGTYTITVTDNAGNEISLEFSINIPEPEPIIPETTLDYEEIEGKKYITEIEDTYNTVEEIINSDNFPGVTNVEVIGANGEELEETDKIGTGTIINILDTSGEILNSYVVSILGDMDGDGEIDIYDTLRLIELVMDEETGYEWPQELILAGDCQIGETREIPDLYDIMRHIEYCFDDKKW